MVDWKSVVFALSVCLLFVPLVFLGVNTFFPELPENTCYLSARPLYGPYDLPECNCTRLAEQQAEQQRLDEETRACDAEWQAGRRAAEASRYVGIMLISLVGSTALLLRLERSITAGMFAGVVATAFIGTVRYIETRSAVGFSLLVCLFLVVVVFIQRQRKAA